jgi:hypothetical protein
LSFTAFSRVQTRTTGVDLDDVYLHQRRSRLSSRSRAKHLSISLTGGLDAADLGSSDPTPCATNGWMLKAGTLFLWQGSVKTQWASSVDVVKGSMRWRRAHGIDLVGDPRRPFPRPI